MAYLAAGACLLAPLTASAGKVYSWVDASGQRHYGDTPPADQQPTVVTGLPTQRGTRTAQPTATPDGAQSREPEGAPERRPSSAGNPLAGDGELEAPAQAQAQAQAQAEADARAAEIAAIKAQNCEAARGNLSYLQQNPAVDILLPQADGSTSRMTTEQHAERVAAAQSAIRENC